MSDAKLKDVKGWQIMLVLVGILVFMSYKIWTHTPEPTTTIQVETGSEGKMGVKAEGAIEMDFTL